MSRWRNGLGAARGPERLVLLQAEEVARARALTDEYEDRCEALGSLVVDSRDLAIRSSTVSWCRHKGYLLIRITVYYRSAGRIRHYHWRKRMRTPAGRQFAS